MCNRRRSPWSLPPTVTPKSQRTNLEARQKSEEEKKNILKKGNLSVRAIF